MQTLTEKRKQPTDVVVPMKVLQGYRVYGRKGVNHNVRGCPIYRKEGVYAVEMVNLTEQAKDEQYDREKRLRRIKSSRKIAMPEPKRKPYYKSLEWKAIKKAQKEAEKKRSESMLQKIKYKVGL